MAGLSDTPSANRIRIVFLGLRNAGKSTLVNAFAGQDLAIVSDTPGTTTDPVSKSMEILPLGPCTIIDTAGLDDEGELGRLRVAKTMQALGTADIAVWVKADGDDEPRRKVEEACRAGKVAFLEYRRGDSVEGLKKKIAAIDVEEPPGLLDGLVKSGDSVVCVCPIDESAPKGRLILPQVQVIRACLDAHLPCSVCQPGELAETLAAIREISRCLVVTDSQAFAEVRGIIDSLGDGAAKPRLTGFSILFARQKGDMEAFTAGLKAIDSLKDGDTVLVAEGCTHHRQCNDIGTVKIPAAVKRLSGGKDLKFVFSSGAGFPLADHPEARLVVHCGGCMLTRREVLRRIALCREAGVPIVNYGICLSAVNRAPTGSNMLS